MKLNKQKIEEIKNKLMNIREKIKNNGNSQVPKKYYALLILMLLLNCDKNSRHTLFQHLYPQ